MKKRVDEDNIILYLDNDSSGLLKYKRSQVSSFIIIAIIILVVSLIFLVIRYNSQTELINPDIQPVNSFVQNCVEKASIDAVNHIGETGGYFYSSNISYNAIAYYFYEDKNYMPSKEKIEEELSKYVNNMLFFCAKHFEELSDYEIKQGEIKTKTLIEDENIIFNIDYTLSIKKGENSYTLKNFQTEIPVRLGIIYKVVEKLMQEQMNEKNSICISCVQSLAEEHDLYFVTFEPEERIIIFYVIDKTNGGEYVFNFASRYEI